MPSPTRYEWTLSPDGLAFELQGLLWSALDEQTTEDATPEARTASRIDAANALTNALTTR